MNEQLGYMAIDQYGDTHHLGDKPPRKALLERFGVSSCRKMYVDTTDGSARHIGYVVAGRWCTVYAVSQWKGGAA